MIKIAKVKKKRRNSKNNLGNARMLGDDDELNLKVVYKDTLEEKTGS